MSKRLTKCLPVLLTVLLLAGCGKRSEQLSTAELSERMAAAVGSATPSEALSALGLPDENLASPSAVGYSKSPVRSFYQTVLKRTARPCTSICMKIKR